MKLRLTVLLSILATAPLGAADAAADLAAVKAFVAERAERMKSTTAASPSESSRQTTDYYNRLGETALACYEKHPADPLRWEAALIALKAMRSFVIEIKPGYDEAIAARDTARIQSFIVRDEAARAAWDEKMDALQAALLAAGDVPPAVLGDAYANAVYRVSLRRGATPAQRWAAMEPLLAAMEQRVTDPSARTRALELAARTVQAADPAAYDAMLQRLSQSSMTEVSQWAVGKANVQAAKVQALAMKFTAVDGRDVDLAKLRGKVVLVDFWATWCGPCKEEIPNVRANYEKYHAQGFEVVAVSLDSTKDRQKLIDYCRDNRLPWPQHFDGLGWKNAFAEKFGVRAIPAMFLIDQDGKVVTTEARGPRLESEIKRLLKL